MKDLAILRDYEKLAMPLDMIAKKHDVSFAYVVQVVHYYKVQLPLKATL